ncbi:transposase, partial [Candidatus Parvarchaeota archaeon]|nr:transposase [Candidatus Acidifodinimicrobium mancum]
MLRAYKFRLYPTEEQEMALTNSLDAARFVYNKLLEHKINKYKEERTNLSKYSMYPIVKEILNENKSMNILYSQVYVNIIDRLDKSFKNFFRRVKENKLGKKQKVGFPRFKNKDRYKSITYPQYGFKIIDDNLVSLSNIGILKFEYHKEIRGKLKIATVKNDADRWYIVFICDVDPQILREERLSKMSREEIETNKIVGIDVGIHSLVATSDGEIIGNPKILNKSEKLLRIRHRQLSKKQKRSKNRVKAKIRLAKVYKMIDRERETFLHEITNKLIRGYKFIILEKLNIMGLVKNHHLAKHILDASWNELVRQLTYKAEEAGRVVLQVDPKNTSKTCSRCGWIDEDLTLKDRIFKCDRCGLEMDRDVNAAKNIYKLGLEQLEKLGTLGLRGTDTNA